MILSGDPGQHPKPCSTSIIAYAGEYLKNAAFVPVPKENNGSVRRQQAEQRMLEGFKVYRAFKHVIVLTEQQRQDVSPGGIKLANYIKLFEGVADATREQISSFLVDLNSKFVDDITTFVHKEPRIVLQENLPRHRVNTRLLQYRAKVLGVRPIVWNAHHALLDSSDGRRKSQVMTALEHDFALKSPDKTFDMLTADTWYVEGALYLVQKTNGAEAGECNNNVVRAAGIITDPREPPDDGVGGHWRLKYLPLAVFVRPAKESLPANVAGSEFEVTFPGAFPILPSTQSAKILMPSAPNGTEMKTVQRTNIPIGDAYVVTDFFIQGTSFKNDVWFVDLAVSQRQIKRACLYVILSRYRSWDDVKLVRPLWLNDTDKERVINAYLRAARRDPDLAAEQELAKSGEQLCVTQFADEYNLATRLVGARTVARS